ncbi:MAG: chorismate-binding protein [Candidatus Bathyarchaeota archaeon]|nr:MAG: chorismate-binding protein [Candidatus Bathyarchaeota archaeon]
MAVCPKCGKEVATPRKSWKMAGRPDRTGKRLQLEIGLFDCPTCGAFRKTLSKKKI